MFSRRYLVGAFAVALALLSPPALAQGQIVITQAKAIAGGVTSGDAADFPVTLSEPGSYKLGDNLSPGPNKNGIIAAAPDITIDLNGFRLSGGPAGGANNALSGIVGQSDRLTVKNGTIGAFSVAGIIAERHGYLVVENMRIVNGKKGIHNPGGFFARIQNSTIATNTDTGVTCGRHSLVEGNVISGNGGDGVRIGSGTVLGNTISANKRYGIVATSTTTGTQTGFGNNTLIQNNSGGEPKLGTISAMEPNVCAPTSC